MAAKQAWTPGPWKWNDMGYCWLEGADGSSILHVDDYGNTCPHRDDANAQLIAKAPEMAAILLDIIQYAGLSPERAEWIERILREAGAL